MNTEITEHNILNWLRFTREILDDKYCTKRINSFIRKEYGTSKAYTSKKIFHKFWD